jgi:Protein of unknown function (DUF2934)
MAKHQNVKPNSEAAAVVAAAATVPDPAPEIEALDSPANQEEIARLAYAYWQARGCPEGSPEEDWLRAAAELRGQLRAAAA